MQWGGARTFQSNAETLKMCGGEVEKRGASYRKALFVPRTAVGGLEK